MSSAKTIETYIDIKNKSSELKSSFIRQILLMSSALLGILISLYDNQCLTVLEKYSFSISLALLSLGILFLTIALYEEVAAHNRMTQDYWEEARKHVLDETYNPNSVLVYSKKIYKTFEIIGYFSFSLSIVSLTLYGILLSY